MTDETEHDKQYSSGCEFTDDYLDRNFELFNFPEDYYFIKKIGIRLSCHEALIYLQLPVFHHRVYEALNPWHEVKAALYHLSTASRKIVSVRETSQKKIVSRWESYHRTTDRADGLMKVKDVVLMAFPLMTREAERIGFVFKSEVIRAIQTKIIKSDNLPAKDMFTNLTLSEEEKLKRLQEKRVREDSYQYAVVSLNELEDVAVKYLDSEVLIVLRIWREYLNSIQKEREALNLEKLQQIDDIFKDQSTQIESPVEHANGLSILPLRTGDLIDYALEMFKEKNGREPRDRIELYRWLTPENLPEVIKSFYGKDRDGITNCEVVRINGAKLSWESFRGTIRKKHKHLK